MSGDRSTRNVLAAILLVAALFVAMNLTVSAAPLLDWWLPLVLVAVGLALAFVPRLEWRRGQPGDVEALAESQSLALATTPGEVHTYTVAQPAPRLHTMTIRPDPESSEFAEREAFFNEDVLPFDPYAQTPTPPRVTPVSPETPAPAAEPQPEVETVPASPETPTPAAEPEPEPVPQSPETPTPDAPVTDAPAQVIDHGPSQKIPLERAEDTGKPAAELKHTARTEYADPDQAVAKKEAAPPPPPDESVTATERTEPEKQVVADTMSAPQQPYDAEQVGMITPERAERVMDDSTDNAHDADVPVVTQAASPRVAAQELGGEGSVGSGDDLVKIDGIGPKISAALKAAGIDSFQKLANTSPETLRTLIGEAGVRLIGAVDSWPQQASYAARGDWEGMENFNAERKRRS